MPILSNSIKNVGHIISEQGIDTDPAQVKAVTHWNQPTELKSLRSFLGFCGRYKCFIANYSAIVGPLTELTKRYPPTQQGKKAVKNKGMHQNKCLKLLVTDEWKNVWRYSKRSSIVLLMHLCWHLLILPNPTFCTYMPS